MIRVIQYLFILQLAVLVCSYTDEIDDGRIIGGQDAEIEDFPYLASLRYFNKTTKTREHMCGGSIIADQWILTAAHCVYKRIPEKWIVVTGTNLLSQGGDVYNIEKIVWHEGFSPLNNNTKVSINDIGLMKLSKNIRFNRFVKKISLPKMDTLGGEEAEFGGWGVVKYSKEPYLKVDTDKLQKITLNIISYGHCKMIVKNIDIRPENICTLDKIGKGTCLGDSGGPLVVDKAVTREQVGIISFGLAPCALGKPDVFTRVYEYVDWIYDHMKEE